METLTAITTVPAGGSFVRPLEERGAVTLRLQMRRGRPREETWQPVLRRGSHGCKFSPSSHDISSGWGLWF